MRRVDLTPVVAATIGALVWLLSACSTAPPVSPAVTQAQNHTWDAAQAFARGDLSGARRDYGQALALHEALADTPARAAVLLSLARIASQSGQPDEATALYKSTQIEHNLRKSGGLRGGPGAEAILKSIFGDKIKFRARTVNIESRTFGDDIRVLDSDILHELLAQMADSQKYRQAGAIDRKSVV